MSGQTNTVIDIPPPNYVVPPFPSLYIPFQHRSDDAVLTPAYLYYYVDIWRFTLLWTIIIFEASYLAASGYAVIIQWRNWKIIWIVPILYAIIAGVEAVIAGSVTGLLLAAVYGSGFFRTSTWTPFLWAVINVFILILSSFSIQGGL